MRCSGTKRSRGSATAASAAWPPAISIRWRRWKWTLLALLWLGAAGSGNPSEALLVGLVCSAFVPLLMGLAAVPSCLRSISEQVGELLVSGISSRLLVDTGAAYLTLSWWRSCPWVLAASALSVFGHHGALAVVLPVFWLVCLPLAVLFSYVVMASLLMASRQFSFKTVLAWTAIFYGTMLALGTVFQVVSQFNPSLALAIFGPSVLALSVAAAYHCRRVTLGWVERGGGALPHQGGIQWVSSTPGVSGRLNGAWSRLGDPHPMLYRYHRSRLSWKGMPVWLWCCSGLGLFGALLSSLHFAVGLAFLGYAAMFIGLISSGSQLSYLQRELGTKNQEMTLSTFSPSRLVDGLALVRLQPRLLEGFVVMFPALTVLSLTASSFLVLRVIWVTVGLGLVWMVADAYASVACSFWLLRRGWFSALLLVAPMLSYALGLAILFSVALSHSLVWGTSDIAPAHWVDGAYQAMAVLSLLAIGLRRLAQRSC